MTRRVWTYALVTLALLLAAGAFGLGAAQAQKATPPQVDKSATGVTAHNSGQPAKALPAPAAPNVVLYDQYDNDLNNGIVSANRTDNPTLSAQAADDFVVPAGQTWTVNEVDIRSPAGFPDPTAFGVYFYANSSTLPGTPVYSATGLLVTGNPDYVITLTTPAVLTAGTYWVSAQGTMNGSNWYWEGRSVTANNPVAWREGGGYGTGCTNWGVLGTCIGQSWPDQMFRIVGVNGATTPTPTATGTPPTATPTACAVTYSVSTTSGTIVPGVTDTGNHQDDGTTTISLPFPVSFYGNSYSTAIVGSNGTLGFVGNGNAFSNACLPAPAENFAILPYWDDQETTTGLPGCAAWANGCGIFTTQVGSTFYIDYHTVLFANTATALEYEIAFTQGSPDIHIVYGTPIVDTASETIGVQQDTGSAFTQYTCNAAAGITSGLEVDFVASTCGGSTPTATPTVCAAGTPGPWTQAAPYPETIVRYGFAQVADSFYVIGGVSNGTAVTTVYRYDVGPGTWTQLADDPGAGEALACAYNAGTNKIYCTEGINGAGFDIYDIGANTWSSGPAIPGGADRYGAAAGSSGSSVYVVGGGGAGPSTDVEVYDTGSNSWASAAAIPNAYLLGGYQTAGQYLYVVGGYGAAPAGASRLSAAHQAAAAPDANSTGTYRLDMSTGTWDTGPAWTPARADFGLAYVDGTLVAMGGDATGGGYFDSTNLVDQLDVSAWPGGSWTASPPLLPTPNRQANQAGFTSSDGRIWSVGGLDGSTFTFLADNYYRSQGGSCGTATPTPVGGTPTATPTGCVVGTPAPWQPAASAPTDFYGGGNTSDGTYLYVAGGYSFSQSATINQFVRFDPAANSWTSLTAMPNPASLPSAVYAPNVNKVFVFGGEDAAAGTVYNYNQVYDVAAGTWSAGAPLPDVRAFMASGYYNGKIYLVAGYNTGFVDSAQTQVWEYDPLTDSYATKTPIPYALGGPGYAVINGHLYVAGGRDANNVALNGLYDYDIAADTWTQRANLPAGDNVPGGAAINGQFWVFGGGNPFTGAKASRRAIDVPDTTNATMIYDPGTDSWSSGPSLSTARSFPSGGNVGNTAVAVGGYNGSTTVASAEMSVNTGGCGTATPTPVGGTPTATPTSCAGPGTWATVTPLPQPLMGPATGSVGGVVYTAGGYNGTLSGRLSPAAPTGKAGKPAPGTEVNTSYAYTDATGWTAIAPDLVAVFDGSGVSDGSSFYVIGGYNTSGGVDTATQIYDPGTNSWSLGAPIPQGVAGAQGVYYNGKIYVIGGCGDGNCAGVLNTVQIYDIAGNSWSSGATVPTGVTFGQAGAIGSYIYYAGGIDQTQSETVKAYRYDPAANTWDDAAMADMPDTQWGGGYTVLGTKLFVIDGVTANFATVTNRVFTYDAATDTWATDSPTNVAAYRMQATNAAGALYVVGGSTSGFTPTNRVERYESPCTTPTATVTGTPPTATSTVTPTLTPCGEAIQNGGFETGDLTNWPIRDSVPAPTVRTGTTHSGTYAAFLGSDPGTEPSGDSSIYQEISVPASGGTLSYWYYPYSEDSITFDWQDAYVTDTSGNILATIMHVCQTTQTWTQVTYNMSAYAGQTVRIEFLVHQDGFGDVTNMYVDDVSLPSTSCGSVTPSETPTQAATATCVPLPLNVGGAPMPASAPARKPANARVNLTSHSGGASVPGLRPYDPISFVLDDGSYENSIGWTDTGQTTEYAALWLQRFTPPAGSYPLTLQHIQITWPSTGGVTPGLQARLVVYLDADGDGDPSNATLLHQELVTVGSLDTFEDYPVNVPVTGPGDIYLGFEDYWAESGHQPVIYPAAIDTDASQGRSWVAAMGDGSPPDINNIGNNDNVGTIDSFGLPGNWMIRASGDTGAIVYCPTNTPEPATATSTAVPPTATETSVPVVTATETPAPGITATETPAPGITGTATSVPPSVTETPGPPTATETPCPLPFTDVHPADYFYVPVQYLYCHGVISGYADHTFRPYNSTTRSQMVKIVVLGFGLPITTPPAGGYTFADVHPDFPFYGVIETAAAANVVSGYDCGSPGEPCDPQNRPYFRPYNNVTRGQLSKIDVVAAGWDLLNPPDPTFTDVLPNTAFYTFVETAACHGIISGYDCGGPGEPCDPQNRPYFRQYNDATRGQISKIVYLSIMSPPGTCPGPAATGTPVTP